MPNEVLSDAEIAELHAQAEKFRTAQRQMFEASAVLAGAQLDMAIKSGNIDKIHSALRRNSGIFDNCDCAQN